MLKGRLLATLRDRMWRPPLPAAYAAAVMILLGLALAARYQATRPPGQVGLPAFDQQDASAMKEAFFEFLRPIARHHNERIGEERAWLLRVAEKESLGWREKRHLRRLAGQYRVGLEEIGLQEAIAILKRRVDIVPESLILIQAAKESGWGHSRFAREGNVLFGERCYQKGCGIVPDARPNGASFEVASFATVYEAVGSYIRNLNTHESYAEFRQARQKLRQGNEELSGITLAEHLGSYSERGPVYVEEIVGMIRANKLEVE